MTLDTGRTVSVAPEDVTRVRHAADSSADGRLLPAYCPRCGEAEWLTPLLLVRGCPVCGEDGEGEYRVLSQESVPEGFPREAPQPADVPESAAEWAEDALKRLSPSVWGRVRWYLESQEPGSFDEFLKALAKPRQFLDVFLPLYTDYRSWEGLSAGYRAVAWDLLTSVADVTFPEAESFFDLVEDLEACAATLRPEWNEPGMDVGVMDDWPEVCRACDAFLAAGADERAAWAVGLYHFLRT